MGRDRSKFRQAIDLKPRAFNFLSALTRDRPRLKSAIGFYPRVGWPAADRVTFLHDSVHRFPLEEARYSAALAKVSINCVDGLNRASAWPDEWSTRRLVALISNVTIPGHTLHPVDRATGKQIVFGADGPSNWHHARPAPVGLRRIPLDGLVCAIPPVRHYGHLLTDLLFPLFFAITAAPLPATKLTVITARNPYPLVSAFVEGLRHLGHEVQHRELTVFESVEAEHLLYARGHCRNIERLFCYPEMIASMHTCLLAACGGPSNAVPARRLYLTRGKPRVRRMDGEDALIELLRRDGFEVLEANWNNLRKQIESFSGASVIAGVHGAGLANLLWGSGGALAIEVMAFNGRKSTGLHWASEAGLNYECLFGGPEGKKQSFSIDPAAVARDIVALADRHEASSYRQAKSA